MSRTIFLILVTVALFSLCFLQISAEESEVSPTESPVQSPYVDTILHQVEIITSNLNSIDATARGVSTGTNIEIDLSFLAWILASVFLVAICFVMIPLVVLGTSIGICICWCTRSCCFADRPGVVIATASTPSYVAMGSPTNQPQTNYPTYQGPYQGPYQPQGYVHQV